MEALSKCKVVVTDFIEADLNWEKEQLEKIPGVTFETFQLKHSSEDSVIEKISDADIIVVNMVEFNQRIIHSLKKCKLVIRHGVGYDNVDVPELTKRNILFTNIPDYCIEEVAEQTVMHLLNCARKFSFQMRSMRESVEKGEWRFEFVYPIYQLSYKTLGIIGCGRIGSMVFQMMQGFQMKYLICDPYLSEARKAESREDHKDRKSESRCRRNS